MLSHIAAPSAHFPYQPFSFLNPPRFFPIVLVISPPKSQHPLCSKGKQVKQKKQNRLLFEFSEYCCGGGGCGVVRMCNKRWEEEEDPALELEVLEFMKNSKNPGMFPTKRELLEAGRVELVEAILKKGGWMSMGWEDDEEVEREEIDGGLARNLEFDVENLGENGRQSEGTNGSELIESQDLESYSFLGDSSPPASSSGRLIDIEAEDDSGIEGILSRLERQRNLSFGLSLGQNGSVNHASGKFDEHEQTARTSKDTDSCHPGRSEAPSLGHHGSMFSDNGLKTSYAKGTSSSLEADTWRTWSNQRAGFSDREFEAAEIEFERNTNGRMVDMSYGEILAYTTDVKEPLDKTKDVNSSVKDITQSDLKSRLQHLELELSSALRSFRSNTAGLSDKDKEQLSEDLRQFSDASEFQENEIMNSKDKLRSLRAKLAVLEGKMALTIIDAQKILDEKQKRIDGARRALQLLRTTCIVWPNSGSEVLLAGSYDGWATQRKMERTSAGIFSLSLKLYPGKYEIKFIVDGSWKVDPLRPIVNHNGYENNLLIIT